MNISESSTKRDVFASNAPRVAWPPLSCVPAVALMQHSYHLDKVFVELNCLIALSGKGREKKISAQVESIHMCNSAHLL